MQPEEFHRLLFEQAGMAMLTADVHGDIIGWNAAAGRMFGASAAEMMGTDWAQVVPVDEREHARQLMTDCLREGRINEFSFSVRDEHGHERRLAAIVSPITDGSGARVGGLAGVRDITNRVILQERLAQKSKMAALGEMAGALSHHFNNILGGVVTSVDFALASSDPMVLRRVMEKTAEALSRATGLVDSLLAFAEGDFRDATLSELGEVIIDLISDTEARLTSTGIGLEVDLRSLPVIEVPRTAMRTVLSNLVDNAIESMSAGGGTLKIAADADEHTAYIRVSDTGCGLDEESLTRIFEPFFSTKSSAGSGKLSRGLGLAVTHGILKVLRGTIYVHSAVGAGTEFEVRLPLEPGSDREQE